MAREHQNENGHEQPPRSGPYLCAFRISDSRYCARVKVSNPRPR